MKVVTKSVEAEAYLYDGNNAKEIKEKLGKQFRRFIDSSDKDIKDEAIEFSSLTIKDVLMVLNPGDYIIKLGEEYIRETADGVSEVFEIIPDDWLERVQKEKKENDEKLDKLTSYIKKNRDNIDEAMEDLLVTQADIMAAFSNILLIRIKLELSRRGTGEIGNNTVFQGNKEE